MYIAENFIDLLDSELNRFYGEPFLWLTLLVFLSIATYTDLKSLKIPNKLNGTFLAVRLLLIPLVGIQWTDVGGSLLAGFALLIPAMVLMQKMGGDIKISFVLGLYIGLAIVPLFLLMTCFLFLSTMVTTRLLGKKFTRLPLAPFLLASHIILLLGTWVIA